jgi:CRISPR-associated endonuclease Csn1
MLTMKKILGLDLGSTSIGWAYIEEDGNDPHIKRLGVRVVPYNGDEKDEFSKGQAISLNKSRTMARTARKTNHRYKLRKQALIEKLTLHGMMPDDALMKGIDPVTLFGFRARSAFMKVTLPELGRVLFLLNQKRGYRSSRFGSEQEEGGKKLSDYLTELKERKELLERENLTIGEYFFHEYEKDRWFQTRKKVFPRECYIAEFDRIWKTQQVHYPEILTDALGTELRDEIIYYQRRLKSQKHLVGECRFEKHHKVAPRSSPLFQLGKVWESINSVSLSSKKNESYAITLEQKWRIFELLSEKLKVGSRDLLKILGLKSTDGWYPNEQIRKSGIQGDVTRIRLKEAFKRAGIEGRDDLLAFEVVVRQDHTDMDTGEVTERLTIRSDFEKQPLYELWHLLYSVDETEVVVEKLKYRYGFTETQARELSNLDFKKDGFGNKSTKAIRKLLPGLMRGLVYSEAADHVGYRHSDGLKNEENEKRELRSRLELYPRNALRQPVVEKILNQLVNLINLILQDPELGRPDEIRVELARELRQSREERLKTYQRNNETDRQHKEIVEHLNNEFPGLFISRKTIEKYKLFLQQEGLCMYSGKAMTLSQVLKGEAVDVDHIIPQSKLFDDSFQNKVLALRNENALKDNATAMDYMGSKSQEDMDQYLERVNRMFDSGIISRAKRDRLLIKEKDIPEDFISRQLNETRYISRESMRLLREVSRNVFATSGSVTDFLRNQWGYNQVLQQLNWSKYEAVGKVKDGKIEGWSKRDDHRHHAIDALVVACTRQSFIQRLNHLNSMEARREMMEGVKGKAPEGWQAHKSLLEQYVQSSRPFTTSQVMYAVSRILVSMKAGKKVATWSQNKAKSSSQRTLTPRGQLHKEQVYGKIKRYSPNKAPLNGRFNKVESIADPKVREIVLMRLEEHGNDPKKAFKDLEKDPIWIDDAKSKAITEVTLWEEFFVYRYTLDQGFKEKDVDAIIDSKVREKVRQRFQERKGQKDHPLKNLQNDPIWLDEGKRIPVTSVRCFTGLKDLVPLHKSLSGITSSKEKLNRESKPVDYVSTRNNHHIAIYETPSGELKETAVTLWEAVERRKLGIPVIINDPKSSWDLVLEKGIDDQEILKNIPESDWKFFKSLQKDEMFVFRMSKDEFKSALSSNNSNIISSNMYRVQKISESYYVFRHHLESRLEKDYAEGKEFITSDRMIRIQSLDSFQRHNPIKVHIDTLGKVKTPF